MDWKLTVVQWMMKGVWVCVGKCAKCFRFLIYSTSEFTILLNAKKPRNSSDLKAFSEILMVIAAQI